MMIKMASTIAALGFAGVAAAQTVATSDGQPLPHCSATVRDRCVQDERFARDTPNPGGSRDNNAMHYRDKRAATATMRNMPQAPMGDASAAPAAPPAPRE